MAIVDFYNLLEIGFLDLVLSRGGVGAPNKKKTGVRNSLRL